MRWKGAWYGLKGKFRKAKRCLSKAEKLAAESDSAWAHWVIARERAHIAATVGNNALKDAEALKALRMATTNGWLPLAKQIQQQFEVILPQERLRATFFGCWSRE